MFFASSAFACWPFVEGIVKHYQVQVPGKPCQYLWLALHYLLRKLLVYTFRSDVNSEAGCM